MAKSLLKGALLGGLVVFLWSAISWMLLPWHGKTMNGFKDEAKVAEVILANTDKSGVYFMPAKDESQMAKGPIVFGAVRREGMTGMTVPMIISFGIDILGAGLITWLLLQTSGRSLMGKVGFVVIFALAAGIVCLLPEWNWWGYSLGYTAVAVIDLIVGWFLAGLVIARVAT